MQIRQISLVESFVITVPVADMRHAPDHRSERISQVLYGHSVESIDDRGEFVQCRSADGYTGWIGRAYLTQTQQMSSNNCVITSVFAVLELAEGENRAVLPYGARIASVGADRFRGPNGQDLTLVFGRINVDEPISLVNALDESRTLLSVPYLWGGTSSFGYDCSGLTQAVYRRAGIRLPRDSKDQALVGREVTLADSTGGDLIFFPGHVAIHLGDNDILHASRLRGTVAVESLEPGHKHFRSDLDGKVTAIRRFV